MGFGGYNFIVFIGTVKEGSNEDWGGYPINGQRIF
jgi:hypothetical protein